MNETFVQVGLALSVGLLLGTFVVLYYDQKKYEQKIQSDRTKSQAMLQVLQARLQRAEKGQLIAQKDNEKVRQDLKEQDIHLQHRKAENKTLQAQWQAATAEIDQLNDNLNRVNEHVEELRRELQKRQNEWQTAVAQNQLLQENLERQANDLKAARDENQKICQRLAVTDVEMKHLQQDLAAAQSWEERAKTFKVENEALVGQLNKAEIRISELKAQVDGAMHQISETQFLRKKLVEMENKLKQAEAYASALQEKFKTMQHTFDHTGKNQLQLIRGIGPAYARRLNEAGITTLNDLAKSTLEQVTKILQPQKWQNVQPEEWIQEAQALSIKIGDDTPS